MTTSTAMANRWRSVMESLPFGDPQPQQDNQRQDPGCNIKMQEGHRSFSSIFVESRMAMPRNTTVITRPIVTVNHGTPRTAPGAKRPTTNEAKMIFAPSKKNPPMISDALLIAPVTLPRGRGGCQVLRDGFGVSRAWGRGSTFDILDSGNCGDRIRQCEFRRARNS